MEGCPKQNEEAGDEMPMSGDDTVRPQTAIDAGGVGRTIGASFCMLNLVLTGGASDACMCGDVQTRAATAFRQWRSEASVCELFKRPQFRVRRGFKCGAIIHESNSAAFIFSSLDDDEVVSRNRNVAFAMWDA